MSHLFVGAFFELAFFENFAFAIRVIILLTLETFCCMSTQA